MKSEPVLIPGAILAVVVAGFGLAVLLGVPLTPEQVGGFVTFAGAVIALVSALQRSKVTPVAKADAEADAAFAAGVEEGAQVGSDPHTDDVITGKYAHPDSGVHEV